MHENLALYLYHYQYHIINESMNLWRTQVEHPYIYIYLSNTFKKANSTLRFIWNLHWTSNCKQNVYLALVCPLLEYAPIVWDPYLRKGIYSLQRIPRNAARCITGDYRFNTLGSVQKLLSKHDLPYSTDVSSSTSHSSTRWLRGWCRPCQQISSYSSEARSSSTYKKHPDYSTSNPTDSYTRTQQMLQHPAPSHRAIFYPSVRTAVDRNHLIPKSTTVYADSVNSELSLRGQYQPLNYCAVTQCCVYARNLGDATYPTDTEIQKTRNKIKNMRNCQCCFSSETLSSFAIVQFTVYS